VEELDEELPLDELDEATPEPGPLSPLPPVPVLLLLVVVVAEPAAWPGSIGSKTAVPQPHIKATEQGIK
jgi:hypothetical protein